MRQEDIAVQLGISRVQYASVERGKYDLTQKNMLMLASIYDVTLDYMMGLTDVREKMPIKLSAVEVELIKTLHEINQEKLTCSILEFLKNGILAQAKGTQSAEASTAERIVSSLSGEYYEFACSRSTPSSLFIERTQMQSIWGSRDRLFSSTQA